MKVFFDTEFTGLRKDTTLISIGCISENNDRFYAELNDFNKNDVDDWMRANVFKYTIRVDPDGNFVKANPRIQSMIEGATNKSMTYFGDRKEVSLNLNKWLIDIGGENTGIEFVSDVCHYDMVLMIDLLTNGGTALELPRWIGASCHDINQDIAWIFCIDERQAFDKNRELTAINLWPSYPSFHENMKHNALFDAEMIMTIYTAYENKRRYIDELC